MTLLTSAICQQDEIKPNHMQIHIRGANMNFLVKTSKIGKFTEETSRTSFYIYTYIFIFCIKKIKEYTMLFHDDLAHLTTNYFNNIYLFINIYFFVSVCGETSHGYSLKLPVNVNRAFVVINITCHNVLLLSNK